MLLKTCAAWFTLSFAAPVVFAGSPPAWVARSNQFAQPVLHAEGMFEPESASANGDEAFDTQIADLRPGVYTRQLAQADKLLSQLKTSRAAEHDVKVQEDLDILIHSVQAQATTLKLDHQYLLQYINVPQVVYYGLDTLLEPRNKPARQARALVRLKRYAGLEPGYRPLTDLARERTEEDLKRTGLTGPYIEDIKQQLDNIDTLIDGMRADFTKSGLKGWEQPLAVLSKQLHDYGDWAKATLQPHARPDARQPEAIYADDLRTYGVLIGPDELITRATADFLEVQGQMQAVAAQIAAERHLPSSDYRDVIRELKKQAIAPQDMLPHYRQRLKDIEAIVRQQHLVTLPNRDANIRMATDAEAASVGSPFMNPPRLIGNTGEFGEFVIVATNPHAKSDAKMDDDSFNAASWTLTAHEARPGHELQFSSMVENGTSMARAIFAENSANVEGWAVYCEGLIEPYMPLDGQLISLDSRLMRVARAFLDPMINTGRITPGRAKQVLMDDVVLSEPLAQSEIDRYAFNSPGQATAYYYGYTQLRGLQVQTRLLLGDQFSMQAFNDFVVSQGLLPPDLMRKAVLESFVPTQLAAGANGKRVSR
ncbi:DUF885 domain-containing protein [Silvimonas iriomotensis]|nr:DUF885 domain-containing protein [Silvimonas iriomotensis]